MSKRYYEVDVKRIDIGQIIVKANSPEEALSMVKQGSYVPIKSEFWSSVELSPLSAREADYVPKRLLNNEEAEIY